MRRYHIVTGILLILSVIYFALAAPVLAQENSQARVGVTRIPKDVTTVLEKRWDEELEKLRQDTIKRLLEKYNKLKAELEADTTSSSSSASSESDHGSTEVALPPAPDPTPSIPDPDPRIGQLGPPSGSDHGPTKSLPLPAPNPGSSTANQGPLVDMQDPWWDRFNTPGDDILSQKGDDDSELPGPLYSPTLSSGYSSDSELAEAEEHMYVSEPSHYSMPSTPDSS